MKKSIYNQPDSFPNTLRRTRGPSLPRNRKSSNPPGTLQSVCTGELFRYSKGHKRIKKFIIHNL